MLREMHEHEDSYTGLLGRPGRIEMAGAAVGHAGVGFLAVDEVAHMQEHVGPLRQLGQARRRRGITAVHDTPPRRSQSVRDRVQVRLAVARLGHRHLPVGIGHTGAVLDFRDEGLRSLPRQDATPALIDGLAAPVLGPAFQVRSPDAGLVEKQARHPRHAAWPADCQIGNAPGALIPTTEHQIGVVVAVVVVEVGEKQVGHLCGSDTDFQQPPYCPRPTVEEQPISTALDQKTRAGPVEQRGRCTRTK